MPYVGAPPPAGPPPGAPPSASPSPKKKPSPGALAAIVAAVVVLGGGGIILATRGGDSDEATDSTAAPDTTPETTAEPTTTVALTLPPTIVPTTSTPPPTTAPPTTLPSSTVVDLGFGVSMPIPAGWSPTGNDDVPTITDGTAQLSLQALARAPGEDPLALMQEYINTFDGDFDAISYDPSVRYNRIEGTLPVDQYGVHYEIYDATSATGVGIIGTAYVYVRADGLSVIYDIFSSDFTDGPPDDAFNAFVASISSAPPLGAAGTLTERDTFRVTSAHPSVTVSGLAAYTLAPGFTAGTQDDGDVVSSTGDEDFEVQRYDAAGSPEAALALAQAHNAEVYPGAIEAAPVAGESPADGISRTDVTWATAADAGSTLTGSYAVFYDITTGNAYAVFRAWLGLDPSTHESAAAFMLRSFTNSFTTI